MRIEGIDLEEVALEAALHDLSRRVRRPAMVAFMWRSTLDDHVAEAMREVLAVEESDDLRERAARVLAYPAVAGMPKGEERRARFANTVQTILNG